MSFLVQYSPNHTSISEFMYYLADRIQRKNPLTNWEAVNLYQVYTDFCDVKNINYLSRTAFSRLVRKYGLKSESVWDRDRKKTARVFVIDEEELMEALQMYTKRIEVTEHVSYIFIGGKKYRIKSTYELIDDLVPIDTPETEEVISQNPDPTGESV